MKIEASSSTSVFSSTSINEKDLKWFQGVLDSYEYPKVSYTLVTPSTVRIIVEK